MKFKFGDKVHVKEFIGNEILNGIFLFEQYAHSRIIIEPKIETGIIVKEKFVTINDIRLVRTEELKRGWRI